MNAQTTGPLYVMMRFLGSVRGACGHVQLLMGMPGLSSMQSQQATFYTARPATQLPVHHPFSDRPVLPGAEEEPGERTGQLLTSPCLFCLFMLCYAMPC